MSKASERKGMKEALALYPLMTVAELAAFLQCSPDHAAGLLQDGAIPSCDIGRGQRKELRIDPVDAAVYVLAQREKVTPREFWEAHGPEGAVEACRRLVLRIRRTSAA